MKSLLYGVAATICGLLTPTQNTLAQSAKAINTQNTLQNEAPAPNILQSASSTHKAESLWALGVQAFQQQNFAEAAQYFAQLSTQQPHNVAALYNGALSEYKMQHKAKALGLWRRALKIDPWFGAARRALAWAYDQGMPQEPSTGFNWWHHYVLSYMSLNMLLAALWLVLLVSCAWAWRAGLKGRRLWPSPPAIVLCSLAVLLVLLIGVKSYDLSLKRATLIGPELSVQTAPNEGANVLFQARAGQQVVVRRHIGDWLLCAQNGRNLGWLDRDSVLLH